MFFQSIYQMMSAGTDLNINIRRTDGKLSVAVMPRRTTLKDETGQAIVPLILNGTPVELDGQFLQAVTSPLQRVQEVLVNLETFEKQAQQAASQGKAARSASSKETKETREKQEKMEKLLKRAEEAYTAGRYSEATTCFRQAKVLADADRQKQIEARILEVQKESAQCSLFPEEDTQAKPASQQQPVNRATAGKPPAGQMQIFTVQPPGQQTPPVQQTYQPGMPQPMYGGYYQNPVNGIPQQPTEYPQMYPGQPAGQQWQPQQWQQAPSMPQPQAPAMQTVQGTTGREYRSQPQPDEALTFDKDDESDRELLREDPYAEYIDFPHECRMKDEVQAELICY